MRYAIFIFCCTFHFLHCFAQEDIFGDLDFDGEARDYILHIPPTYDGFSSVPLVFNLHGLGSNAAQQLFYSNMNVVSDTANFIICYPNAIDDNWNSGFSGSPTANVDDVGFISALIDHLSETYAIDEDRVYSTGMSNGGFMSYRLACELSDRIVAVASVTGLMGNLVYPNCGATRAMPVLQIHGTNDPTVNYNGELGYNSVDEAIEFWRQHNNCEEEADFSMIEDINTGDGATAEVYHYATCDENTEVMLYKIIDGEHTWPGAPLDIGITCKDFSASEHIWWFFKRHSFDDPNSIDDIDKWEGLSIYPNPVKDVLHIDSGSESIEQIELFDLEGRAVLTLDSFQESIPLSDLSSGTYLLHMLGKSGKEIWTRIVED